MAWARSEGQREEWRRHLARGQAGVCELLDWATRAPPCKDLELCARPNPPCRNQGPFNLFGSGS